MKILKEPVMAARNLKQLEFESSAWKRKLAFMKEENVHLKNRLSEILRDPIDKNLLKKAESFQNSFIREDDVIDLLRHDVFEFDNLLLKQFSAKDMSCKAIKEKYETICNHLGIAEMQFRDLKNEFNSYLSYNF